MILDLIVLIVDLLLITGALWLASMALSMRTVAPYVSAAKRAVPEIVSALGPLSSGSVFYELGAGDGRVLLAVAHANPTVPCIGIEKYPIPYLFLSIRVALAGLPNVSTARTDVHTADLRDATHLYAYLFPQVLDALLPKLVSELPENALLVSLDFRFSEKEASFEQDVPEARSINTKLFGYRF